MSLERRDRRELVDLHRVIDDQIGGVERVDPVRVTPEPDDRLGRGLDPCKLSRVVDRLEAI